MRKKMVPFANASIKELTQFIKEHVTEGSTMSFEVSDPKSDGTVFVRFKSMGEVPAQFLVERFVAALTVATLQFSQIDNVRFRLALIQFAPVQS